MLKGLSEQRRAQDAPFKGSAQHRPSSQEHLREDTVCCQLEFLVAHWKCGWVFAIQRLPADGEDHVNFNFIKKSFPLCLSSDSKRHKKSEGSKADTFVTSAILDLK